MKRLLIANRGEVVLRVLRTAREMGLETIAVYSEADRDMEYLSYADEAVQIGPAQPSKSYLNVESIISAALVWKANAIHPGYGFLSENPSFAALCEENGIAFIGPSSTALRTIGNKSRTKQVVKSLNIPTIPGSYSKISNVEQIITIAKQLGMPVILKSLYGGGGRGMKVAYDENQLRQQFVSVSSEANAAFGRNEVYMEHYLSCPRHLEVQILADGQGGIQVLGDRECSIQRRHQKIIEEAPIPNIDTRTRDNLWKWSEMIIGAIGFKGLGTVEYLMDQSGSTYFLEINGRLQVEHPVTEMVTGIDLVREQLMIAAGSRLSTGSASISGHAIECRVNAENPAKNFMPTTGSVTSVRLPGGPGTRVDTHLFPNCAISSYYDPLLVKLIAHHSTRTGALKRMTRMLNETRIEGVITNIDLLLRLLANDKFLSGNGDTSLVMQLVKK